MLADLDAFNAQEGQHYRQHMRFNEALRLEGAGVITAPALVHAHRIAMPEIAKARAEKYTAPS